MAEITQIDIVDGIPTGGTGEVPTLAPIRTKLDEVKAEITNTGIDAGTAGTPAADVVTVQGIASMTPLITGGNVAHDAADSGNPQKIGAKAVANLFSQTMVVANDRANAYSDLDGGLIVRPICSLGDIVSGNASNTDGTSTPVIAASGDAAIKTYLTRVIVTNMHATTMAFVEMKSGTTVKATIPCPPGGATVDFNPPLPPNAANEAWNFDPSAAVTTIYCTAVGFKSKV